MTISEEMWRLIDRYVQLQINYIGFIGTTDYKGCHENDLKIIKTTRHIDEFLEKLEMKDG